jgi:hypothetical protein
MLAPESQAAWLGEHTSWQYWLPKPRVGKVGLGRGSFKVLLD